MRDDVRMSVAHRPLIKSAPFVPSPFRDSYWLLRELPEE
jgi:hypothetical protein